MSENLELLDENIFAWAVSLNIHVKYLYKVGCAYLRASQHDILESRKKIWKLVFTLIFLIEKAIFTDSI